MLNAAKSLAASLHRLALSTSSPQFWRSKLSKPNQLPNQPRSVEEETALLEVRIWAFVVVAVTIILFGIVTALLYSVTFVTQPIKSMAPIDQAYTKMLNDIVLLMTGSITTLIGMRVAKKASEMIAAKVAPKLLEYNPSQAIQPVVQPQAVPVPTPVASATPDWNFMNYKNPELDESWVPPPPPTTPADHLHPEREEIALERAEAAKES